MKPLVNRFLATVENVNTTLTDIKGYFNEDVSHGP